MIEIGANQAERSAVSGKSNHGAREQFFFALATLRFLSDQKHENLTWFLYRAWSFVHIWYSAKECEKDTFENASTAVIEHLRHRSGRCGEFRCPFRAHCTKNT